MMQIAMMILATILSLFWIFLHFRYKNSFNDILAGVQDGEYSLSEIFYIGFGFLQWIRYDMEQKNAKQKIKLIAEVYGKRYAAYYYYVMLGAKVTYILTFTMILFLLTGMSGEWNLLFFGALVIGMLVWYLEEKLKDKVMGRRDELMRDYPQMLSKLALLVNAGMPIREAWNRISASRTGVLYTEMQITQEELKNGVSELIAYKNFGERCSIKPLKKFASLMIQNLQKGSAEVVIFLQELSKEAWEEKKHIVRRQGEMASTKLILPIMMIFIGIIAIIMIPMIGALSI